MKNLLSAASITIVTLISLFVPLSSCAQPSFSGKPQYILTNESGEAVYGRVALQDKPDVRTVELSIYRNNKLRLRYVNMFGCGIRPVYALAYVFIDGVLTYVGNPAEIQVIQPDSGLGRIQRWACSQ